MDWLPPLNIATEDKGAPSIIVDPPLALDPVGPLLTIRLGRETNMWLCGRALWSALDQWAVDTIDHLIPGAAASHPDNQSHALWDRVRLNLANLKVYWLAECVDEASLPKNLDTQVLGRFETLLAALASDPKSLAAEIDTGDLDSLMLAGAMADQPLIILTIAHADEEPPLVRQARQLGARATELTGRPKEQICAGLIDPLLMRAGVLEWIRVDALRLAFVRLVAPHLLFFEPADCEEPAQVQKHTQWLEKTVICWGIYD